MSVTPAVCLNCGAQLGGLFCSHCGQRAIAAYPTLRELLGDAWLEVSGWDGRFARTFRTLLRHPGLLTVEALAGRRARYVSPVRLYLVASVTYFLIAALSPNVRPTRTAQMPGPDNVKIEPNVRPTRTAQMPGPDNVKIDVLDPQAMTPEDRLAAERNLERAPWWAQAVIRPAITDPAGFRRDFLTTLPRVLFVLVPVFAAILSLFYRRRHFPQHLLFGLHLHAAIFTALAVGELAAFTGNVVLIGATEAIALVFLVVYVLVSSRRVYGERWAMVLLKTAGIATCYLFVGIAGLLATFAITALA